MYNIFLLQKWMERHLRLFLQRLSEMKCNHSVALFANEEQIGFAIELAAQFLQHSLLCAYGVTKENMSFLNNPSYGKWYRGKNLFSD